jgi:arginine/lysine/ornithine decarboxylase
LIQQPDAPFYAPGHKRGQGIPQPLAQLLGTSVFKADLPELPQLDNLFAPAGVIEQAQALAAQAFGAERTWFLVNGSTAGIIAAILATCRPGDKIILPRTAHQSAIAGLILSGAIPLFIAPTYDPDCDLAYSLTPAAVETALEQHPDAKAVMVVYPTYQGICCDLEAIAEIAHQHDLPLLVDEAHGAHFSFHSDLPPAAIAAGADLSVQSTHKVLGAMTQASMLHLQGQRIDPQQISKALQLIQSTSPSYLLLASLDAARAQMALQGQELLARTLALAEDARNRLSQIPGLSVLELPQPLPGFRWLDRTRLTVNVAPLGLSGFEADALLHEQLGVTAELPMPSHLTFIISIGNTARDIDQLVQAFTTLTRVDFLNSREDGRGDTGRRGRSKNFSPFCVPCHLPISSPSLSPRDAFFAVTETLELEKACDRISAELICPYPPGIPILMPGELITPAALTYLQQGLSLGASITGCSDPSLKTIKVIRRGSH